MPMPLYACTIITRTLAKIEPIIYYETDYKGPIHWNLNIEQMFLQHSHFLKL